MARVTITPGSLTGVRTARKRRRCDGHMADRHWIEVGDPVVLTALPPGNRDVGNTRWLHHTFCAGCCPARFLPVLERT